MYEYKEILGPYIRGDNRKFVVSRDIKTGKKSTISYPKYLMECHLGRYLTKGEVVHHKNGNPMDNEIENLEVLSRVYHSTMDKLINKPLFVKCQMCGKEFEVLNPSSNNVRRTGYFCSKQCTGKYGAEIQNNRLKPQYIEHLTPDKERPIDKIFSK